MPKPELIRGLGFRDSTILVIGTILGTGVFLKTTPMAQAVNAPRTEHSELRTEHSLPFRLPTAPSGD